MDEDWLGEMGVQRIIGNVCKEDLELVDTSTGIIPFGSFKVAPDQPKKPKEAKHDKTGKRAKNVVIGEEESQDLAIHSSDLATDPENND